MGEKAAEAGEKAIEIVETARSLATRPFTFGLRLCLDEMIDGGFGVDETMRVMEAFTAAELTAIFEKAGLPFAPIVKPEELFDDPHLQATGGLAEVRLTDGPRTGQTARAALLPFTMDGQRLGVRSPPPSQGEHTDELLQALGLSEADIAEMRERRDVA